MTRLVAPPLSATALMLAVCAADRQAQVGSLYKQYVFIVGAVAIAVPVLIFNLYMR